VLEHVVIVTDSLSVDGGSAKVALGSARALAERGFRVTVFGGSGEASDELARCPNLDIVNTGQGDAFDSPNRFGGAIQGLWNRPAAARMGALLATLDREHTVVHVHGWTKSLSSSVVARVVRAGFRLVITLHDYFTACPNGCLYLHGERRICTLKPMSVACVATNCDSRNYAVKLYRVLRQFVQQTAGCVPNEAASFISVSTFSRRVLAPMLPVGSRVFAVDNPVDATRGERVAAEANGAFVFVGRLSPEKGGTLLAEAARRANVPVTFIGDGPDRAAIARINPEARFVGWVDRREVKAQLRAARCLVMPSLWSETNGLVVLEAAALGIPAIVPSGSAAADLIEPGRTGLAFKRGDAGDLTAQLRACANDDHLVSRLSRATYTAFWRKAPTMHAHVDRLLATYHDILAGDSAAAVSKRSA
jgi:glycosyltransferase involved in cell wall biosynthesis